ncbi:MAG: Gfo/Idh/MocA family oxidoreductase [Candidatus Latescibacteria bacterium]|nr:Gfo/Idh/MocA family oxidoreductase [Candidatus Latescibacterota bacterium]
MYRVGLIGNRAHQMTYGPIIESRDDCQIVAAAEHNAEKAKPLEDRFGVSCACDYDAVLEDPNVDVVSIATDFYLKRSLITKAVACGKHVLVDKSLARTVREARETIEGVRDCKVKIALSYAHRYQPTFVKLGRAVRDGTCRRVAAFTHYFVRQFPDSDLMSYVSYPTPPRVNGGGDLLNLGSHPFDSGYLLFGIPSRVY